MIKNTKEAYKLEAGPICKGVSKISGQHQRRLGFIAALVLGWFLVLPSWSAASGPATKVLLGLTTRAKLFSLDFRDKQQGLAVGDVGFVLETKDGGNTWTKYKNKNIPNDPLFDVCLVGPKAGWIVGKNGLILHTADGGASWEKQNSGTRNDLMAVKFVDEKRGFIAGAYGIVLRTVDGGATWITCSIDWEKELKEVMERSGLASPHLYDICFVSERQGWIVGENGVVLSTTDAGVVWHVSQGGLLPPLFSVSFRSPSEGLAVGLNGYAMATQDGRTWRKIDLGTKENLFKIRTNKEFGLIVGEWGSVLVSGDAGKTWKPLNQEDRETMTGVYVPGEEHQAIVLGLKTIRRIDASGK